MRWIRWSCVVAALLAVNGPASGEEKPEPAAGKNRLAKATSPYLRLHATNPVQWYEWGKEAFEAAKQENKPIFLSVGYSSCHWCHVMNRESFSDAKIAEILNKNFICIKLDREERPDVDKVYMDAVQSITGSGGWPLSAFLLPDGRIFTGGTYFPPADKKDADGKLLMLGFPNVLERVLHFYTTRRGDLEKQADAVEEHLRRSNSSFALVRSDLTPELVRKGAEETRDQFDPLHGGVAYPPRFAPKFPQPTAGLFLLAVAAAEKRPELIEPVYLQAVRMARGGIVDQVGGGFHRYSVDREWIVPHFEKMLYDQGQLLSFYSQLYRQKPEPLFARAAADTVRFLKREMTSPEGLFYSALDADSEHVEGKFYVWTVEEIKETLGAEADWVLKLTGADGPPNFEDKYIPVLARPTAELAKELSINETELWNRWDEARAKLLARRAGRIRPLLDTKIITGWNGLMVVGLADAAAAFDDRSYKDMAVRAADQMLAKLRQPDGSLYRHMIDGKAHGVGYADDYAATVLALLAVHRLEAKPEYLTAARELADILIDRFWDDAEKSFFYTGTDAEKLVIRSKETHDGAVPSSNSLASLALLQLAEHTGVSGYRDRAAQVLQAFSGIMSEGPVGATAMLRALHHYLKSTPAPVGQPQIIVQWTVTPEKLELTPGKETEFKIQFTLAKGWHINANPASPDYLKPTVLSLTGAESVSLQEVKYPKALTLEVGGIGEKVQVYEGVVVIAGRLSTTATAKPGDQKLTFRLDYQACDDQRCLAPTNLTITVPVAIAND